MRLHTALGAAAMALAGCATPQGLAPDAPSAGDRPPEILIADANAQADSRRARARADAAVAALQAGDFGEAAAAAKRVLETDPDNSHAHLVAAITGYRATMHQLSLDARTVVLGGLEMGGFNYRYMRSTLTQADEDLAAVDASLAKADLDPAIAIELCPACWQVDWNQNRRIDRFDRRLFQIEVDADGNDVPKDDPRRKPTFRLDHGDVAWARAFVSFQRAALSLLLAYDWDAIDALMARGDPPEQVVFRLKHPQRVAKARELILAGLNHSDRCRRAYLLETDDDREWVPNPSQKSHPLPLPMDVAVYATWEGTLGDLTRLLSSQEGLSVAELAQHGDHQWDKPPGGYLDLGRMLSDPKDIVLRPRELERRLDRDDVEAALRSALGRNYVKAMKPSPLLRRLQRMKSEIDRGEESFERKLRYLIWIN